MNLDEPIGNFLKAKEIVCISPTLNEGPTISKVIQRAKQLVQRVVIVDGYSDDDTVKTALNSGADVILQDGTGKGMAIRTIFKKISGDVFVIIDGDGTYDPCEMEVLLRPILNDEADMVVGSRLAGNMEKGSITRLNKIGNKLFNWLINYLYKSTITDSQSGYRALNRKAIESLSLTSEGFEIETELTVKALKNNLRVKEIPITYTRRRGSLTKLNAFKAGSKILKTIFSS
jgi:glycosyltransferase involved in cell wall biosynthesis